MAVPSMALINPPRSRIMLSLVGGCVLLGLAYALYWFLALYHFESTDDAYVQGNIVQITPQVPGTVVEVAVHDTDFVHSGQVVVQLDPADSQVAVEQAKADLAQTVREVRMLYASDSAMLASVAFKRADDTRSAAELARVEQDLYRRQGLAARGVISKEDLAHAAAAVTAAESAKAATQAAMDESEQQLRSSRVMTEGVPVAEHPKVLAAAARLRGALLNFQRTHLPSPVNGYVAKRSVQLGQRIQPGANLMAVVPLDQVWVDANFKEVQLSRMRVGQPVSLTADVYGNSVKYQGKVAGMGAGTGAAFALLPAQNATGNWIKVVQRVPIRIQLDPQQLRQHPLRIGLSMHAKVDVSDQSGKSIAEAAVAQLAAQTTVFTTSKGPTDRLVQKIIADNLGAAVPTTKVSSP